MSPRVYDEKVGGPLAPNKKVITRFRNVSDLPYGPLSFKRITSPEASLRFLRFAHNLTKWISGRRVYGEIRQ